MPFLTAETTAAADKGAPRSLVARIALGALRLYKLTLSPMFFAGACRFSPSCSDYTAEAIRLHGALKGVRLGLVRFSRCRPFGGHGIDPVPRP